MPSTDDRTSYIAPHVVTLDDLKQAQDGQIPMPYDPAYRYRILSEGDSWFSLGAIPSSNLLFELGLDDASIVVNLAYPGDTLETMSSLANNPDLEKMLHDERFGYKWDLILLSGGGNDLISRAPDMIRRPTKAARKKTADWIRQPVLEQLIEEVQSCYRKVVAIRDEPDSINAGKPIVIHTYDYLTPRNAPARFLFAGISGPWLYPLFEKISAPDKVRVAVSKYLIDRLAEGLLALSKGPQQLPNFYVADTRDSLAAAPAGDQGNSNDWLNEIHPNHQGYRKLAKKISARMRKVL